MDNRIKQIQVEMDNRGQITIFLSLLLIVMLLLGCTAIEIANICMNKSKVCQAVHGAVENLKAGYNRELFDRYHLLLLDKTNGGMGEASLEETINEYLAYTLEGEKLVINDIRLSEVAGVLDNDCEELKNQISEYMELYWKKEAGENLVNYVLQEKRSTENIHAEIATGKSEESSKSSDWSGDDPREVIREGTKEGVLNLVLPEGRKLSKTDIDTSELPSHGKTNFREPDMEYLDFSDVEKLQETFKDEKTGNRNKLQENIYGVSYVLQCFDYFTCEREYGNLLECEAEYIICGKSNDYDNMQAVVNRLILHRLPVNMVSLLGDSSRLAEIESVAAVLSLAPGITYGAAKYLLIAAYSYAETIVEIKALLSGKHIPLIKNGDNWLTDITNPGGFAEISAKDYRGADSIDYKGFLMVLLGENVKDMYYRIGDVITINLRESDTVFSLENYIFGFSFDVDIAGQPVFGEYDKSIYDYRISAKGSY